MTDLPRDEQVPDATSVASDMQRLMDASSFGSPQALEDYTNAPHPLAGDVADRVLRRLHQGQQQQECGNQRQNDTQPNRSSHDAMVSATAHSAGPDAAPDEITNRANTPQLKPDSHPVGSAIPGLRHPLGRGRTRTLSPGLHRNIVAVDIEGSTARTNPARARLRHVMYDVLEEALQASGIAEPHHDPLVDRGDGILVLIHPVDQVPTTLLLNKFIPTLSELLADHGERRPDELFRLRAAVHAGEVHYDRRGPFGEAVDITCRLLDAPAVKTKLSQTEAPLVVVVSEDIHRAVIRHGYVGIDDRTFEPLVQLEIAGYSQRGWVHVPAEVLPDFDVYPTPEPRFDEAHQGKPARWQQHGRGDDQLESSSDMRLA